MALIIFTVSSTSICPPSGPTTLLQSRCTTRTGCVQFPMTHRPVIYFTRPGFALLPRRRAPRLRTVLTGQQLARPRSYSATATSVKGLDSITVVLGGGGLAQAIVTQGLATCEKVFGGTPFWRVFAISTHLFGRFAKIQLGALGRRRHTRCSIAPHRRNSAVHLCDRCAV
jgi:hypothetical protein